MEFTLKNVLLGLCNTITKRKECFILNNLLSKFIYIHIRFQVLVSIECTGCNVQMEKSTQVNPMKYPDQCLLCYFSLKSIFFSILNSTICLKKCIHFILYNLVEDTLEQITS